MPAAAPQVAQKPRRAARRRDALADALDKLAAWWKAKAEQARRPRPPMAPAF